MSDVKVTTKRRARKTPKRLDYEIELYRHVRAGDRHPRLAILDDDGVVQGAPSKDQVKEFVDVGTVNGRHDLAIGIRYEDRRKNNVAISLTRKEAHAFLRFL